MSAQNIPTEQQTHEEEEDYENMDGEEPSCYVIPKLIIEPMKDLYNQLADIKKEINIMDVKIQQILKNAEEGQDDILEEIHYLSDNFSKMREDYSKLKYIEKNQYMILVRTENHPPDQVEVFIASPKMHSFQSHQAGKYSKKFDIKEKYMSADFYSKLQAELKACEFVSSWNDRSKSFWCKKDTLPLVMSIIKANISEFRSRDELRAWASLQKSSGEQ